MTELLATPGVQLGTYSTPVNPVISFAWGTNTTFATQADARAAFLEAISKVGCPLFTSQQCWTACLAASPIAPAAWLIGDHHCVTLELCGRPLILL